MGEGTIFGIIAAFFGLLSIGYAAHSYSLAARSRSWPSTEGTVTQISVKHTGSIEVSYAPYLEERYLPVIQYTYTVRSRPYSGNRILIGELQPMPHVNALEFLRPYRDGMKVRVYYDRSNPAFSVLETRVDTGAANGYMGIGIAILVAVIYFRFFWGR